MNSCLKSFTTYSLRKSTLKCDELVKKATEFGVTSLATTDKGNIFSAVKMFQLCKKAKIKPILGIDLYIKDENNLSNLTLLCKNLNGWKTLLKIIVESNSKENYNVEREVATIGLGKLCDYALNDFICYSGSNNSNLARALVDDYGLFSRCTEYDKAKSLVSPDWKTRLDNNIARLQELFGKDNFFLELQKTEEISVPATQITNKIIEDAGKRLGIPIIGTAKPHYLNKRDSADQHILICVEKKSTLRNIKEVLDKENDTEYFSFFRNDNSYFLSPEEMKQLYSPQVLENNDYVASLCGEFDILNNPKLPKFKCEKGKSAEQYLAELCENGWSRLPIGEDKVYRERLVRELQVLNSVGLADYFLIVHDIIQFAHSRGWLATGRGSAGGSLVAYLLDLVESDPIKYNLVFERFYNAGRNQPGKISYPDIDTDVESLHREEIITYIRDKYDRKNTANIVTFSGLKGAGSLKEVFRVKNIGSSTEMNQITKLIIDEHKISDELEERRKEGLEASIIRWSLENTNGLKQYAYYDDNDELQGEMAEHFAQAIKLEGCKRSVGKHAAGILVSNEELSNFCPMVNDKRGEELICGWEMGDIEAAGGIKLDILSVAALDDISETIRLVNEGDLC